MVYASDEKFLLDRRHLLEPGQGPCGLGCVHFDCRDAGARRAAWWAQSASAVTASIGPQISASTLPSRRLPDPAGKAEGPRLLA